MLIQIISHTPAWAIALFVALLLLGYLQSRERRLSIRMVIAVPLLMAALSLYSLHSLLGIDRFVLGAWLSGFAAALLIYRSISRPLEVGYHAGSRAYVVPGSWLPLLLMMGIFLTQYVVRVALAMHWAPAFATAFHACVAAVFGLLSGTFAGRSLQIRAEAARRIPSGWNGDPGTASQSDPQRATGH